MRLNELLTTLSRDRLEALATRFLGNRTQPSRWAYDIEHALGQFSIVDQALLARKPPVASLLVRIVDADDRMLDLETVRAEIDAEVESWCRLVTLGDLANRITERSRIYRRVLEAAWSDDEVLDGSEIRLLNILREELGLLRMEHFLLAHHSAIQPLWRGDHALDDVVRELAAAGILYEVGEGRVALPDELVPHVRNSLGVAMSKEAARRLLARLDSGTHLKAALEDHDLPTSGSKQERAERIIQHFVPMGRVVDTMHIDDARELARKLGLPVRGAKEELVNRLVDHFVRGGDLAVEQVEEAPAPETKQLTEAGFTALFECFKGHQLQQLLLAFQLRHSGAKQARISTLWSSPYAEATLLSKLKNPDLDELLAKCNLVCRGSKSEKVAVLIDAFRSTEASSVHPPVEVEPPTDDEEGPSTAEYAEPPMDGERPVHDDAVLFGVRGILREVELSSKSPTRFDALRAYLGESLGVDPVGVGVKWLADPKNHRNRIGEALRGNPAVVLLLAPREESEAVLDAVRSRMALSPNSIYLTLLGTGEPPSWDAGTILSAVESPLVEAMVRAFGGAEILHVPYPREVEREHVHEIVGRAEREMKVEWARDDLLLDSRVRRGLLHAFGRTDTIIRTKHISDAKNVGNRISEAIGAGCGALVLIVAEDVAETTRLEVRRQLATVREPLLAVLIVESEDEGYVEPEVIAVDREY